MLVWAEFLMWGGGGGGGGEIIKNHRALHFLNVQSHHEGVWEYLVLQFSVLIGYPL